MVLMLDGKSKIGAHVCSNIDYLIWLRYICLDPAITNMIFLPERLIFLHSCATRSELPSNISTKTQNVKNLSILIRILFQNGPCLNQKDKCCLHPVLLCGQEVIIHKKVIPQIKHKSILRDKFITDTSLASAGNILFKTIN